MHLEQFPTQKYMGSHAFFWIKNSFVKCTLLGTSEKSVIWVETGVEAVRPACTLLGGRFRSVYTHVVEERESWSTLHGKHFSVFGETSPREKECFPRAQDCTVFQTEPQFRASSRDPTRYHPPVLSTTLLCAHRIVVSMAERVEKIFTFFVPWWVSFIKSITALRGW